MPPPGQSSTSTATSSGAGSGGPFGYVTAGSPAHSSYSASSRSSRDPTPGPFGYVPARGSREPTPVPAYRGSSIAGPSHATTAGAQQDPLAEIEASRRQLCSQLLPQAIIENDGHTPEPSRRVTHNYQSGKSGRGQLRSEGADPNLENVDDVEDTHYSDTYGHSKRPRR